MYFHISKFKVEQGEVKRSMGRWEDIGDWESRAC